jgi:hypothetical protein
VSGSAVQVLPPRDSVQVIEVQPGQTAAVPLDPASTRSLFENALEGPDPSLNLVDRVTGVRMTSDLPVFASQVVYGPGATVLALEYGVKAAKHFSYTVNPASPGASLNVYEPDLSQATVTVTATPQGGSTVVHHLTLAGNAAVHLDLRTLLGGAVANGAVTIAVDSARAVVAQPNV